MYRIVLFLGVLAQSSIVFSQAGGDAAAKTKCEQVMNYVSIQTDRDFGREPCEDNSYSEVFWACVENKVRDDSPFYLSVQHCERTTGYAN